MTARCKPLGVSTVEAHLLGYCLSKGTCPISELLSVLGEKPSSLTAMLDRLEAKTLITRELNVQDRRSWLISLRPKGLKLAKRLRILYQEFEAEILAHLQPEQLKHFNEVMQAIGEVTAVNVTENSPKRLRNK